MNAQPQFAARPAPSATHLRVDSPIARRLPVAVAVALASSMCACASSHPAGRSPRADVEPALYELEAQRTAGLAQLLERSRRGEAAARARVARALGRVGGQAAVERLLELVSYAGHTESGTGDGDDGHVVRLAALFGLALAGPDVAAVEPALVHRFEALGGAEAAATTVLERARIIWVLGRIGSDASLPAIAAALANPTATLRAEALIAVGMFARRKVSMNAQVHSAVLAAAGDDDNAVHYATAYALRALRAATPPAISAIDAEPALSKLWANSKSRLALDAEARALVMATYATLPESSDALLAGLGDLDWRVQVVSAKALADSKQTEPVRAALARALVDRFAASMRNSDPGASVHVVATGLAALDAHAKEPAIQKMAETLVRAAARYMAAGRLPPAKLLTVSMVHCLASALQVRSGVAIQKVWDCGGKSREGWPRHARRALAAELIVDGFGGDVSHRIKLWSELAADSDSRVRAAALEGASKLAKADAAWIPVLHRALEAALADSAAEVVGAAASVVGGSVKSTALAAFDDLAPSLVRRAGRSLEDANADLELVLTLLEAVRDGALAEGAPVCARGLENTNAAVRAVSAACAAALGKTAPARTSPPEVPARPPARPSSTKGAVLRWELETTRGRIVIELEPERAPWHVAAVVKLTKDGFYNGLMWHRVVPGFVVQGGSPDNSSWGGPGFVVPGEPSFGAYDAGVVGIADAGMDTGGSQFFIMHARAPHLEGRYTRIGRVISALEVVDALQVGDRIVRATMHRSKPSPYSGSRAQSGISTGDGPTSGSVSGSGIAVEDVFELGNH